MKKILLVFGIWVSTLFALDLSIGDARFHNEVTTPLFTQRFSMDVDAIRLHQEPSPFFSSYYYAFDLGYYRSKFLDRITTFFAQPLTTDFFGMGSLSDWMADQGVPVPAEYKIRGIDLNVEVGYRFDPVEGWSGGIGIGSGFSMPVMKMRNIQQAIGWMVEVLDETKTKIYTYKLLPTFWIRKDRGALSVSLHGGHGFQTGHLENDYLRSEMDIDGTYTFLDLQLRYRFQAWSLNIGYLYQKWDYDRSRFDLAEWVQIDVDDRFADMQMQMQTLYVGVGYRF